MTPVTDPSQASAPVPGTPAFSNADGYERFMGRWSRRLAGPLLEFAEVQDGDHILDVGSGTGSLALTLAARTAHSTIVGIDPAAAFVDHARSRTTDPRVRFEIGDAQRLPFGDATFDRAIACLVFHFVPDGSRAAREMRRVTRPGGIVVACTWDSTGGMQMLHRFWEAALALDPAADAMDERRRPFTRPGELAGLWRSAGLGDVEDTMLEVPLDFASFEDFWAPFLFGQGPVGSYVVGLAPERQAGLRARLRADLWGAGPDRPLSLSARAWAVRGRVPAA